MEQKQWSCEKCRVGLQDTLQKLRAALIRFDEIANGRIKESDRLKVRLPIILAGIRLRMYQGVCIGGCNRIDVLPIDDEDQVELDLDNEVLYDLDKLPKGMHTSNKEVL